MSTRRMTFAEYEATREDGLSADEKDRLRLGLAWLRGSHRQPKLATCSHFGILVPPFRFGGLGKCGLLFERGSVSVEFVTVAGAHIVRKPHSISNRERLDVVRAIAESGLRLVDEWGSATSASYQLDGIHPAMTEVFGRYVSFSSEGHDLLVTPFTDAAGAQS